jgi:FkbM family methyltransferase
MSAAHRPYNVALGKPATQSSISPWSSGKTPEEDAAIANNGDTSSSAFFHTLEEAAPWWQVDLGEPFVIEKIKIYNRRDQRERLRRFLVLGSQTGQPESCFEIGKKTDNSVFGADDTPYTVVPHDTYLARYVRVQLDIGGFLHFRECEVIGYPPHAEELLTLSAKTEDARRGAQQKIAARLAQLSQGRNGFVSYIDANALFVDREKYSNAIIQSLSSGYYEVRERQILRQCLKPTDRVLEVGTALGAVTMSTGRLVGPSQVMTYDANPAMIEDARRNFVANEMGEITSDVGVLRNRSRWSATETQVEFYVSRDFWASRLFASANDSDIIGVIKVPLVRLEDKISEHRANVLICDIEGGEIDLLTGADLGSIRLVMMEIHPWTTGRAAIDDMVRYLMSRGFNIDFATSGGNIVVLDRVIAY